MDDEFLHGPKVGSNHRYESRGSRVPDRRYGPRRSWVRIWSFDKVILDNGLLQVTLSNPEGIITGIKYAGLDNLMEVLNDESNRDYWDLVWNAPGSSTGIFDVIKGTSFKVIMETDELVEVSFTRTWDPSVPGKLVPLNIDKRFITLRGSSGFFSYAIYQHLKEWPGYSLGETRNAFKLRKDKFHYMAMVENRQRCMPLPEDRPPPRGQALAYPEADLLMDPVEPEIKGEVDDKYQQWRQLTH